MRHPRGRRWLNFSTPVEILSTHDCAEVRPLLETIERRVQAEGLWAAGFVSYGAAPAFDAALPGEAEGSFPKLWFALFSSCRITRELRPVPLKKMCCCIMKRVRLLKQR